MYLGRSTVITRWKIFDSIQLGFLEKGQCKDIRELVDVLDNVDMQIDYK